MAHTQPRRRAARTNCHCVTDTANSSVRGAAARRQGFSEVHRRLHLWRSVAVNDFAHSGLMGIWMGNAIGTVASLSSSSSSSREAGHRLLAADYLRPAGPAGRRPDNLWVNLFDRHIRPAIGYRARVRTRSSSKQTDSSFRMCTPVTVWPAGWRTADGRATAESIDRWTDRQTDRRKDRQMDKSAFRSLPAIVAVRRVGGRATSHSSEHAVLTLKEHSLLMMMMMMILSSALRRGREDLNETISARVRGYNALHLLE